MHKISIIDKRGGAEPLLQVALDGNPLSGVYAYSVEGGMGDIPKVAITLMTEDMSVETEPEEKRECPF